MTSLVLSQFRVRPSSTPSVVNCKFSASYGRRIGYSRPKRPRQEFGFRTGNEDFTDGVRNKPQGFERHGDLNNDWKRPRAPPRERETGSRDRTQGLERSGDFEHGRKRPWASPTERATDSRVRTQGPERDGDLNHDWKRPRERASGFREKTEGLERNDFNRSRSFPKERATGSRDRTQGAEHNDDLNNDWKRPYAGSRGRTQGLERSGGFKNDPVRSWASPNSSISKRASGSRDGVFRSSLDFRQTPRPLEFKKKVYIPPKILFFHNPSSPVSVKYLCFLRNAQRAYPRTFKMVGPPLDLDITVEERLPTVEELEEIFVAKEDAAWSEFIDQGTSFKTHATGAKSLLSIIKAKQEEAIAEAKAKISSTEEILETDETPDSKSVNPDIPVINNKIRKKHRVVMEDGAIDEEPSTDEEGHRDIPVIEIPIKKLDLEHPLFGTESVKWPLILWDGKHGITALNAGGTVRKLTEKSKRIRDGTMSPEEKQALEIEFKATAIRERRKMFEERDKRSAEGPTEEDTLTWLDEERRSSPRQRGSIVW